MIFNCSSLISSLFSRSKQNFQSIGAGYTFGSMYSKYGLLKNVETCMKTLSFFNVSANFKASKVPPTFSFRACCIGSSKRTVAAQWNTMETFSNNFLDSSVMPNKGCLTSPPMATSFLSNSCGFICFSRRKIWKTDRNSKYLPKRTSRV